MNRRRFLTALAAIPLLRRLAPGPALDIVRYTGPPIRGPIPPLKLISVNEYLKKYYSPEFIRTMVAGDRSE